MSRFDQLQIFERVEEDEFSADFQRIKRHIPSQECDYASHNLHPYPAKFIPHYPQVFIKHLTGKSDIVVDPMCGYGTTLIESCLAKRKAYGIEIDPIGFLCTSVSTTPLAPSVISKYEKALFDKLEKDFENQSYLKLDVPSQKDFPNHNIWFREDSLKQLLSIQNSINAVFPSNQYRRFALLCLSAIVRDVSNADPRDIFPQRDLKNKVRTKKDVLFTFRISFSQNKQRILNFGKFVPFSQGGHVTHGDARNMPYPDEFANLVFTSPPYAYAIDYARVHQLSTLLLLMNNEELRDHRKKYIGTDRVSLTNGLLTSFDGFEFARSEIIEVYGKDKKCGLVLYQYFKDMTRVTQECYRILKPGGYLVYVIGNSTIKQTAFSTDLVFQYITKKCGFTIQRTFERPY
ncbi:MAG: DNA methyltransferase, partial [Nitrososphaerales archaeon]